MFKGATVLMAAGMIATTSAPAVQAAAPSVMSIVQQAMNMGVAATEVASGTWCDGINYVFDSDGTLTFTGTGELRSGQWGDSGPVKKVVIGEGITQISMSFSEFGSGQNPTQQSIESIELPSQLTTIGAEAFRYTKIKSINIPDNVTIIGDSAFSDCTSLASIIIPDRVTSIGNYAFSGCTSLNSINIPDSVNNIGDGAFYGCQFLSSVKLPTNLSEIKQSTFNGCRGLSSIDIPDSVTSIGGEAFSGCENLLSVTIPNNVTSIGLYAFNGCTSLESVNIQNKLDTIEYHVFSGCTQLKSIDIPDSVTIIGPYAFSGCYNLQYINGGNNVTRVELNSFYLNIDDIPEDKKSQDGKLITYLTTTSDALKNYNWAGDKRIVSNETAGESVETGDWCTGFVYTYDIGTKTLTISPASGSSTTTIEKNDSFEYYNDIKNVVIEPGCKKLSYVFSGCANLENVSLPEGLEELEGQISYGVYAGTFYNCKKLTHIDLPTTLKTVGVWAFNKSGLIDIDLKNVETIDYQAFAFTPMTEINIPDSVKTIYSRAFTGSNSLKKISGGNGLTAIGIEQPAMMGDVDSVFKYSAGGTLETTLVTNNELLKNYGWAADNRTFASTDPSTPSQGESCGTDATFVKSDDGTVTIEGTGKVDDSAFKDHDDVTKVVISEGITEIGNETFKNMDNLETVTLPDSVDKIGDSAFANDPELSEVKGGSDTITVADNAFAMDDYSIATQPLVVESKAVYNSIMRTPRKQVSLKSSGSTTPVTPPLTPAAENWSYSDVNNQFETDKFSIPSETADWNIIMDENYNVNGLSEKQGYKSMYSKATSNNEDTVVVCDKASHWMIAIPKDIILDGASAESTADYRVGIAGEVDPAKRVTVTPDQTVTLVNQGNDQITYVATVDQPVTGVNGFDIVENFADAGDTLMNGHISATIKRAGSYKGNMSFAIDYVDYVQG